LSFFNPSEKEIGEKIKRMKERKNVKGLIKAMSKGGPFQRRSAARALGYIGDHRAIKPLIKTLIGDRDQSVRNASTVALGRIGDPKAVEPLIKELVTNKTLDAAETLGKLGDCRAVEPLIKTLLNRDCYIPVRVAAVNALGEIGDSQAVEPLIKTLLDKEDSIRIAAAMALDNLSEPAWKQLTKYTLRSNYISLASSMDSRLVGPLIETMKNKDEVISIAAAEALEKLGPQAVEALIDSLNQYNKYRENKNRNFTIAAAKVLVQIYNNNVFNENLKKRILEARKVITEHHSDYKVDCTGCNYFHSDDIFTVEFPL
jgi:HEAT repeat protein